MVTASQVDNASSKWVVLAGAGLGVFSLTMNGTAMITALPAMRHEFDLSPTMLHWIVTIYFLVGAIFLSASGRLGDRFGYGLVFLAGTVCFMASYLIIAIAPDAKSALIGRAIQGLAGGLLLPMSLALVRSSFPPRERHFAAALWSGLLGLGLGVGPIVGGLLTEFVDWRGIFWLSLAVVAAAFAIVLVALRGRLAPSKTRSTGEDYLGFIMLAIVMAATTYAITHAQPKGSTSSLALESSLLAIAMLVGLCIRERRVADPFLNLALFSNRDFVAASLGIFSAFFLIYTILVFASIFIQNNLTLGYSAARAGLALLPLTLLLFVLSTLVNRLVARLGQRRVVTCGMLLLLAGTSLLHLEVISTGILGLEAALLLCGLGLGTTLPVFSGLGVQTLPPEQTGQGSGMLTTFTFLGATMGVSIGGLVSMHGSRSSLDGSLSRLALTPAQVRDAEMGLHTTATTLSEILSRFDDATAQSVRQAMSQAVADGFADLALVCAIVALIGAIAQFLLLRQPTDAGT